MCKVMVGVQNSDSCYFKTFSRMEDAFNECLELRMSGIFATLIE